MKSYIQCLKQDMKESFEGSFDLGVPNVDYDCSYSSYLCLPTGGSDVDNADLFQFKEPDR